MIGDRIREARRAAGVSQAALGETLGISQVWLSQWETGKRTPSVEWLVRLADHFGVSMDWLAGRV